jgi:hypothetical protein
VANRDVSIPPYLILKILTIRGVSMVTCGATESAGETGVLIPKTEPGR